MKTSKQLLIILSFLLSPFFSFSQVSWEMNEGAGPILFDSDELFTILGRLHGGSGAYEFARIPGLLDPGWTPASVDAKGDLYFETPSILAGFMTGLDFTYFRTTINIEDPSESLIVRFNEIDDGVRAYVFNANFPYAVPLNVEDTYIPDGDARLYATPVETDISPLLVQGENTIILVQFDDSRTRNYLSVSLIGEEELNSCERDIRGPEIFARLEDGSEVLLSELTFDTDFECGEEPSFDLVVRDNCDPDALIVDASSGTTSPDEDGNVVIFGRFTAVDASENESTATYSYTITADREGPIIESTLDSMPTFTLDLCNKYMLSLEELGIAATDNCTPADSIRITLSRTEFEEAGDSEVTVTATDATGNESTLDIKINLETNPDFITITADDDVISKTAAADGSIILTEEELLANDTASDGSELEIQDLELINPEDGRLVDNRDGTYTFMPSENFSGALELTYLVKSRNATLYFEETGHYYEYVPFGTSWDQAAAAATARKINGINGYLATITSQAENDFIFNRLEGNGWIGASDAAMEGEWRWVTGPEGEADNGQGLLFWSGNGVTGSAVDDNYSNWGQSKFSKKEPNNLGNEDYAHFVFNLFDIFDESEAGTWNDFRIDRNLIDGYIVEYGGIDGCTPNFTDDAMVSVTIIINENNFPNINNFSNTNQKITRGKDLAIQISPNPFRTQTTVQIDLPQTSDLEMLVRDMSGKIVQSVSYNSMEAGQSTFMLDFSQFNRGVYFISVRTASAQHTMKAVVIE